MIRRRYRTSRILLTVALAAAVGIFFSIPPRARQTHPPRPAETTLRGAYHIHTTRSDGALDREQVARAAARAGLQFAIFTEHGDGTHAPLPPEYLHGVLCVDATEISTNQGHYVAIGAAQAPYRLGGDAEAVAEDVARLGGVGIAAHPLSPRPELAWSDWSAPISGMEWLNADSEWRDERRTSIAWALLGYPWRPSGALAMLLDRPVSALAQWDALAARQHVIGLAAHDAHGGPGEEAGSATPARRLRLPSYESLFRTFSVHVRLGRQPTGDAREDASLVVAGIRKGAVYSVIDAIASPGNLDFRATTAGVSAGMGDSVPSAGATFFSVTASVPSGASTALLRDGHLVAEAAGGALEHTARQPGVYRVEIRAPDAPGTPQVPWLVSNPIYKRAESLPGVTEMPRPREPLPGLAWRVEKSDGTSASLAVDSGSATLAYRLAAAAASPFAAIAADLPQSVGSFSAIAFAGRASRPMRVSAQLRFAREGGKRWRSSHYLDQDFSHVVATLSRLRPADGAGQLPSSALATSLLLVVDLTNAAPGESGSFSVRDVSLIR